MPHGKSRGVRTSEFPLTEPVLPNVEIDRPSDWPAVLSSVRDYWNERRGSRMMPSRGDISPAQIKSLLPYILLADVVDEGRDFRYRVVGTNLREFFYFEPTGKLMSEAIAPFGAGTVEGTLASYHAVMERRAPMRLTGSGSWFGQNPKYFDALLAPMSDDDVTVNMIFGTFIFAWDHEHQFRPPRDPRLDNHAPA
jgi:hypothetical protein